MRGLALALLDLADREGDALMPGYTHGQRAQPVWLGQHLAAHVLGAAPRHRPARRRCAQRADVSPAGAAALAGSSLPLDPARSRAELGFAATFENSIDAVADRDYCAELVFACALAFVHLSRLAEELVLWSSAEYGFAQLDDSAATGSSIMPQKKNPDPAELARGKAGTAVGRLAGLLATLKGVPLAYNRDLQEDKRACFDQVDDLLGALAALGSASRACRWTRAAWPPRPATAPPWRPTWPSGSCRRACRSGTAHAEVAARVAAGERFDSPTAAEAAAARQSLAALHDQLARARSAVSDG